MTKKIVYIFPLWTFHFWVATFHQHLYMVYLSLSWCNIPGLMVPIMIYLSWKHIIFIICHINLKWIYFLSKQLLMF